MENLKYILDNGLFPDAEYIKGNQDVYAAIISWMEYKDSKKPKSQNHYANEKSICALLKQFVKYAKENGSPSVQGLVDKSLSGNYVGIVWDYREKKTESQGYQKTQYDFAALQKMIQEG